MKKKGSAILIVIGAITVLMVLAYGFISSSKNKTTISKYLSDEKKAEALAESTNDFIIQYIKKNANKHEDNNPIKHVYLLLRAPLKKKTSTSNSGGDAILDVSDINDNFNLEDIIPYHNVIDPLIEELGWQNVSVNASCTISMAESFSSDTEGYKVTTIDEEHLKAVGNSAKFLDDLNESSDDNSTYDWKPSEWKVQIKFPDGDPNEEKVHYELDFQLKLSFSFLGVDVNIPLGKIPLGDITIKVSRQGRPETSNQFYVTIDLDPIKNFSFHIPWPIDEDFKPFYDLMQGIEDKVADALKCNPLDLEEKLNESHFFPEINPKTLEGLRDAYSKTGSNINYDFSEYKGKMTERKDQINYDTCFKSGFNYDNFSNFGDESYYLEKGAILRITTTVVYPKSNTNIIQKKLVSEIPFKVSDVQPIAPEYSFFIANTEKVSDPSNIVGATLGEPISLNKEQDNKASFENDTPPAGQFIVHNLPVIREATTLEPNIIKDKIYFDGLDGTRIPGMVRVNSDYSPSNNKVTQLRSFFGIVAQPELTEFNKFFTPFNVISDTPKNKFNTLISFCWDGSDKTTPKRYHDIELPVIFETESSLPMPEPGVKNLMNFVKSSGFQIISVPTLLFGTCHMEYPLGLRAEGPIDTIYSRTRLTVNPKGRLQTANPMFEDLTEVSYKYENVTNNAKSQNSAYDFDGSDKPESRDSSRASTYGMTGSDASPVSGYDKGQSWNSNSEFKYCPANCYDVSQYAKKATKYYEDASSFLNDGEVFKNGILELNGVYYIKGDLTLNAIKYKGNGLIVCGKKNITLNGDITREDDTSTLGIIARTGVLTFENCGKVQAACFSNNAPICNSSKLYIEGNLVCNTFKRDAFGVDTYINYDNTICTVTPFASHRKYGKFEPKRYAVSFSDNWSKFEFEKMKN